MRIRPLRRYDNPDLSDYVIHFVSRYGQANDAVDARLRSMSDRGRLFTGILATGLIRAFPVFYGWDSVVCFTECTPAGVQTLIRERRYAPWGVAFTKDFVFAAGGGPAFYVRADEWAPVRDLPPSLRARCTKFWPGADSEGGETIAQDYEVESEWTHEREWRVLGTGDPPGFRFTLKDVAFLIIGDWDSANRDYCCVVVDSVTGGISDPDTCWLR